MQELKQYFITVDREYKEGDVAAEVFRKRYCKGSAFFYGAWRL